MEDLLLQLESRIRNLLEQQDNLKHSNKELNQGKFSLARENEKLLDRQEKAVSQIQALVTKLKAIEKIS